MSEQQHLLDAFTASAYLLEANKQKAEGYFIGIDPASPEGDYGVKVRYKWNPDGSMEIISVENL